MGDLLRCRRPGGAVAALLRDPHPGRRLRGAPERRARRPRRLGSGAALLRGPGGLMRVTRSRAAAGVAVLAVAAAVGGVALAIRPSGPAVALGAPHYVDETRSSGLDHTYSGR